MKFSHLKISKIKKILIRALWSPNFSEKIKKIENPKTRKSKKNFSTASNDSFDPIKKNNFEYHFEWLTWFDPKNNFEYRSVWLTGIRKNESHEKIPVIGFSMVCFFSLFFFKAQSPPSAGSVVGAAAPSPGDQSRAAFLLHFAAISVADMFTAWLHMPGVMFTWTLYYLRTSSTIYTGLVFKQKKYAPFRI